MDINWNSLLQTLTSTAVIVAAVAFMSRALLNHLLERDVEKLKTQLSIESNRKLEELKSELSVKSGTALEEFKTKLDTRATRDLEKYKTDLAQLSSREERIREQVIRWANPILGAVRGLESRLSNILYRDGYLALSKKSEQTINPNWSISYDYFMPSTLYLFAQYFCWVRLLEEQLSFELFSSQQAKDRFYSALRSVSKALGGFPASYEGEGRDMQVFTLQQRGIGEALMLRGDRSASCMNYYEFLTRMSDPTTDGLLGPLRNLLEGLRPGEERRWKRLKAVHWHLQNLEKVCRDLLELPATAPTENDFQWEPR